jgi:hypothetical protein
VAADRDDNDVNDNDDDDNDDNDDDDNDDNDDDARCAGNVSLRSMSPRCAAGVDGGPRRTVCVLADNDALCLDSLSSQPL